MWKCTQCLNVKHSAEVDPRYLSAMDRINVLEATMPRRGLGLSYTENQSA